MLEVMMMTVLRKSTGVALAVGQPSVVEHLEQRVEHVRVRLLDLVEQHHGVRLAPDRLGELAALLIADVAGRRANQPGDRVPLLVFGHVDRPCVMGVSRCLAGADMDPAEVDARSDIQDLEEHLRQVVFDGNAMASSQAAVLLVRGAIACGDHARAAQLARATAALAEATPDDRDIGAAASHVRGLVERDRAMLDDAARAYSAPLARAQATEDAGHVSSGTRRSRRRHRPAAPGVRAI
jgi:hypothetical protein